MYALIAAAAAMGLTAWFVLAADASDRARTLVAGICILSLLLQLAWQQRLAGMLVQVVLVIGLLMYRRFHAKPD
ncbi:MAG: hypothetical protein ABIP16_07685 [Thermomonas sp.]